VRPQLARGFSCRTIAWVDSEGWRGAPLRLRGTVLDFGCEAAFGDFGWCRPAVWGRLLNYPAPQAVVRHRALLFELPRPRLEGNMAQDLIADQDTGINVAIMRGGEVFRDDREGARIAIVLNDYLYDLNGGLIGHLKGRHVIDANTRSMPIGFRKLLEGKA
jgi:hypothetical protein